MRTSLEKAFAVLEVIAAGDEPVSLKELAQRTGHNASTLSRVLSDLVQIGYLRKEGYRRFTLDLGLIPLGQKALTHFPLPRVANPLIYEAATRLGVEGSLSGLHRGRMVYLYRARMGAEGGTLARAVEYPLHRSIAALAILAGGSDEEARSALARSLAAEPRGKSAMAAELSRLLERVGQVRADGYARSDDEGGWNVSLPLPHGGRTFAVSLHAPGKLRKAEPMILECSLLVRRVEQALRDAASPAVVVALRATRQLKSGS